MSDFVKPFAHKEFKANNNRNHVAPVVAGIVAAVSEIAPQLMSAFKEKVTPEMQEQKAGVWYKMLDDFVNQPSMTGQQLGAKYESSLPFKQRKTKSRFVANNLVNKSRSSIINHLIKKINDELSKGGLPTIPKNQILLGMGVVPAEFERALKQSKDATILDTGMPVIASTPKLSVSDDPAFNIVKPLTPVMKNALKSKGVIPSSRIDLLTQQFYNNIVRKDQPTNLGGNQALPEIDFMEYSVDSVDAATDAVITAVVQYVRNLKEQDAQGAELSRVQEMIVSGTKQVETKIIQSGKDEAAQRVGTSILFEGKWVYIIGGAIALILLSVAVFKK